MKSSPVESTESAMNAPTVRPKRRRGFAAMDPKKVQEIARKGGRAAHEAGTAHRFNATEAREAGRKGGMAPHRRRGEAEEGAGATKDTGDSEAS